jgi:hypothetical protein
MGERQNGPFQLSFHSSLKVDFQGSRVTSDGGLILVRELDERLGFGARPHSVSHPDFSAMKATFLLSGESATKPDWPNGYVTSVACSPAGRSAGDRKPAPRLGLAARG